MVACLCVLPSLSLGQETAFFVSPQGDDAAAGVEQAPFATISRAQQAIRDLKARRGLTSPVIINILGGTYELEHPLVFMPEDSGTADCPVTYRGLGDRPTVISGGRRIEGFQKNGHLWTVTLDDVKAGNWDFNQLYVNDHRRIRARTPNEGEYFRIRSTLSGEQESRIGFVYTDSDIHPWQHLKDAVFFVFGSWYTTIHHVDRLDVDNNTVWFTNPSGRPFGWYEKNLRYYVENIAEGLDQPGEWYLDRKTGVLSYYPLPGETLETAVIVAPVVRQTLVQLEGVPGKDRYLEHVHLKNLRFRHTDAYLPKDLYDGRQGATVQEAGIVADGARDCVLQNCEVANMGEHGIWFRDDCHRNVIRKCHVHDLGGGGIYIGEKWRWGNDCPGWPGYRNYEDIPHFTEHNVVDNCFVHDGCYVFAGSIGIWIGQAAHTTVTHNDVCDMSYSGISVGWDWSGNKSTAHHNLIERNHIHHLGHGRMNDMAGIYTLGVSPGTTLRHNLIHDVRAYQSPVAYCLGAGVYLDQSSAEITVEKNVCYNISNAGFFLHHGAKNRVLNNVLADVEAKGRIGWGMYYTARGTHADTGNTASKNIVYGPSARFAKATRAEKPRTGAAEEAFVTIDNNLYWSTGNDAPMFSTSPTDAPKDILDFSGWQKLGYDIDGSVADPLFVDAAAHDYRLSADSPARSLGIDSIDVEDAGLYGEPEWANLPKEVALRSLDPEFTFTPTKRLSLTEDYEKKKIGYVPDHVQKVDPKKGATIEVTDVVAADGQKCLRFADAPGLEQPYHPNRVWRDLRLDRGTVQLSFDCMNSREKPATFSIEMRDWTEGQYRTGPRLQFLPNGTLHVDGEHEFPCKAGRWYHVEIAFELGSNSAKQFDFAFALKGSVAERQTIPFVDRHFRILTWIGLMAMDRDRQAEFYLDNLRIEMK